MICEFALDPALVARWHDPREWAFFREAFDANSGRVGSEFPRKWRKDVRRAFHRAVPGSGKDSLARRRLEALLTDRFTERMVKRETTHSECETWLEKAVAEHQEHRFHGILSLSPVPSVPEVITPDTLFSERPPDCWAVPPNPPAPRTAAGLAQVVAPLLVRSREVVFVDPHFDPNERRYREPIEAMLSILWGSESCVQPGSVRLIMAEGTGKKKRDPAWVMTCCKQKLPSIMPRGRGLNVTILRERTDGEKCHNRYILTELAGVSFGVGLDADDRDETEQPTKQSDDLCRLSREQLEKRWGQYVSANSSWFDVAAGPVEIRSAG